MSQLTYDPRLYKYIKTSAIPNEQMAYVEYIKNSYDSYLRLINKGEMKIHDEKYYNMIINAQSRKIYMIDRAEGMTSEQLTSNFSQVGQHTGGDGVNVNALFSKGATDTTALGTVQYVSIKDGKLSQCRITFNDIFYLDVADRKITDTERAFYQIPNNGTYIELTLKDSYIMSSYRDTIKMHHYFSLKNIMDDNCCTMYMTYIDVYGNTLNDNTPITLPPIEIKQILLKD
jgi:hypothetical protein